MTVMQQVLVSQSSAIAIQHHTNNPAIDGWSILAFFVVLFFVFMLLPR